MSSAGFGLCILKLECFSGWNWPYLDISVELPSSTSECLASCRYLLITANSIQFNSVIFWYWDVVVTQKSIIVTLLVMLLLWDSVKWPQTTCHIITSYKYKPEAASLHTLSQIPALIHAIVPSACTFEHKASSTTQGLKSGCRNLRAITTAALL